MLLIILSFFAGVLTILAPCVLPLLPIILGVGIGEKSNKLKPYIIILSLGLSILVFTLLLKVSTIFIDIPNDFWKYFSGIIVTFFGVITLFPNLWKSVTTKLGFSDKSNQALNKASQKKGYLGDVLLGFSLGPVFSSCSPTYSLILVTVLPQSFLLGLVNLISYILGLSLILVLIVLLGQKFTTKLRGISDPKSKFKKVLGVIFILVGLAIMTGYDKKIEAKVLSTGFLDGVTEYEYDLIDKIESQ